MAAAYFIVLERKVEGLDCSMEGKALARASEALEDIAMLHSVRPLTGFTSIDPEAATAFLDGEGIERHEIKLPPVQQFSAEDGLATIKALISHLHLQPSAVRNSEGVLGDLRACERILTAARQKEVRWHFEVDF